MKFIGNTKEYLHLETIEKQNCDVINEKIEGSQIVLWFTEDNNHMTIDGQKFVFNKHQIIFLTEFHRVTASCLENIRFLRFNRSFYCILDHDQEVSCKGMLFFGASELPFISIPKEDLDTFNTLWKMFAIEMDSNDSLQIDMLQMMLKRYLILCARLYKQQKNLPNETKKVDLIREFNFLVEQYFRTKHSVAEYAELLHKSPKTLSNLFSKSGFKTPLQFIQDRRMLEARRLLVHTDKQVKEIAFEVGFEDVQSFSRFFKNLQAVSPTEFRDNH